MKLKTLFGYYDAPLEVRKSICNGCGTSGWKGKIVPETIWGLNITEICHIHDWGYHFGSSSWDKERADLMFLENMNILISNASWWFRWIRRRRALKYYWAVKYFGQRAFMSDKEGILTNVEIYENELHSVEFVQFCDKEKLKLA